MENNFVIEWQIDKDNDQILLRDFLYKNNISKRALTDIKYRGGKILVNNLEVTVRYLLHDGDNVVVIFPKEIVSTHVEAENIPLQIVYEDDYLLIINKQPFMNTIPSREHPTGSIANALIHYYNSINHLATAHIVTRLDRNTSGLLLIAKHRHIHHLFSKQQQKGKIIRQYEAFAKGIITCNKGVIEQPIARKSSSIIEREINPDGQYACTKYEVVNYYDQFTHVQLQLKTGRTHQIRVHLAHLGHPLLGDSLYGQTSELIKRHALHCHYIKFTHPISNELLQFEIPLPRDMNALLI